MFTKRVGSIVLLIAAALALSAAGLPFKPQGALGVFSPTQDVQFNTDTGAYKIGARPFSGGRVVQIFSKVVPVEVMTFDFEKIKVPTGVKVTSIGARPLILLAEEGVAINGVIDVSGGSGKDGGALSGGGGGAGGGALGIFADSIFIGVSGELLARGGNGGASNSPSSATRMAGEASGTGGAPGKGKDGGGDGGTGGNPRNGGAGGNGSTGAGGAGGGGAPYGGAPGAASKNGSLVLGGPTPNAGKGANGGACDELVGGGDGGEGLSVDIPLLLFTIHLGDGGSAGAGGAPDGGRGLNGNETSAATGAGSGGGGGGGAINGGPGGAGGSGGSGAGGGGGGGGADNCKKGGNGGSGGPGGPSDGGFDYNQFIKLLKALLGRGVHLPGFLKKLADTPLNEQPQSSNPHSIPGTGGSGGGGTINLGADDGVVNQGLISAAGGEGGGLGTIGVMGRFSNSGSVEGDLFQTDAKIKRNLYLIGGAGGAGGAGGDGVPTTSPSPTATPTATTTPTPTTTPAATPTPTATATFTPSPTPMSTT
jgi:hypothetical protein